MSLLLQALLGANVDGSGLSFHVESQDACDNLPMAMERKRWPKKGRSVDGWWGLGVCHPVLYLV